MIWAALGLALLAGALLWYARKAGADAEQAKVDRAYGDAAARAGQATADGPRTRDDVVNRLRNGAREL